MKTKLSIMGYINKGYEGQCIGIECDIRNGFPGFDIVGLPDSAIKEARERVRTALRNSGFKFPQNRVLVSLSPASQPKTGSFLDLGIALSLLFASTNKNDSSNANQDEIRIMVAGELKLNGDVIQAPDTIGAIECAKANRCSLCLIPFDFGKSEKINVLHVTSLTQAFLACGELINVGELLSPEFEANQKQEVIFEDILGLEQEKEILSMAASGFHSLLMFGPPGVGKTMLSKRISKLLPKCDEETEKEIIRIYGCANLKNSNSQAPSRLLSHDITAIQFNSGNTAKSPGEGALAHGGVLILDEADKYSPKVIQAIQSAYDCGITQSSKSGELITYPARFMMVANMNPCSCGGLGNHSEVCTCTAQKIDRHWKHLGWQFIDRFDVRIPIKIQDELLNTQSKPDSYYLDKIAISADRQRSRYKQIDDISLNGEVHFNTSACRLLSSETSLLTSMKDLPQMNPRSMFSIITLARTIADYNDRDIVSQDDILQAISYRQYGHGDYYWRQIL